MKNRRFSDSDLIKSKNPILLPSPDIWTTCPNCLNHLLFLYCAECKQWYRYPVIL